MSFDVYCPFCKIEFAAKEWVNGNCPSCNEEYWWDEICAEDYSDCWASIEWDYKKLNKKE